VARGAITPTPDSGKYLGKFGQILEDILANFGGDPEQNISFKNHVSMVCVSWILPII